MTRSTTSNLPKKAILSIIGSFARFLGGLIPAVILVRYLSHKDYGTFCQIILITQTIGTVMSLGLHKSIYYFVPLHPNKREVISQGYLVLFIIGVIAGTTIFFFSRQLGTAMNNHALYNLSFFLSAIATLTLLQQALSPSLFSTDRATLLSMLNLGYSAMFILSILIALHMGGTLWIILSALFIVNLIFVIICFYTSMNIPSEKSPRLNLGLIKKMLIYGFPLFLSELLQQLSRHLDKYMISVFFSPEQFAVYSRGAMELPLANMITYPIIAGLLMPIFVAHLSGTEKAIEPFLILWQQTIKKIALILFPIATYLFAIAAPFITFMYTDAYSESTIIFQIYLLQSLTYISAYDVILQASGKPRYVLIISLLGFVLNCILNYALIPLLGTTGPALASVLTVFVTTAVYLLVISRVVGIPLKKVLPWEKLNRVFGASFISGASAYLITCLNIPKFAMLVSGAIIFSIVYLKMVDYFHLLDKDDLVLLNRVAILRPYVRMATRNMTTPLA